MVVGLAEGVVHSFYSILIFRSEKKKITGICSNTRKDSRGELLKYHYEVTWTLLLGTLGDSYHLEDMPKLRG